MKAILEFNLPEDREQFETVNKASDYYSLIFDIYNSINNYLKYQDTSQEKSIELLERIKRDISKEIIE